MWGPWLFTRKYQMSSFLQSKSILVANKNISSQVHNQEMTLTDAEIFIFHLENPIILETDWQSEERTSWYGAPLTLPFDHCAEAVLPTHWGKKTEERSGEISQKQKELGKTAAMVTSWEWQTDILEQREMIKNSFYMNTKQAATLGRGGGGCCKQWNLWALFHLWSLWK